MKSGAKAAASHGGATKALAPQAAEWPMNLMPEQPREIPVYPVGVQTVPVSHLPLQCKLAVGLVNDPLESAADAAADRVMMARPAAPEPVVRRKRADEESGASETATSAGGDFVLRQAAGAATSREAPPIVHQVLRAPGHALDTGTRTFMESRFGESFSHVRIHSNRAAGESAQAIHAHAYTLGSHIVFAPDRYSPSTADGRRLLAHELAHTLQQRVGGMRVQRQPEDPDKQKKTAGDQGSGGVQRAPVNDISDNPMHEERLISAFDVTPGNKRPWNLNLLTKTIFNALKAEPRAYIRILGVYPTIAGEDDPQQNAYDRADTVRKALIQWIGPGKFSEDRFDVAFADGQIGEPQIQVDIAYKGVIVSDPQTPLPPSSQTTAATGSKADAGGSGDLQSALGGQWAWHLNRSGKPSKTVQLQLTRGSGPAQEVYQFSVDVDTGDLQFMGGMQVQAETRTVEALKGALKVKGSVFLQLLGGLTRANGQGGGSLTFQVQGGAQVTATFGPVTVSLQAAPSITYTAGQPIALDFNLAPQGGATSLPSKNPPPFIGIPILVGTF